GRRAADDRVPRPGRRRQYPLRNRHRDTDGRVAVPHRAGAGADRGPVGEGRPRLVRRAGNGLRRRGRAGHQPVHGPAPACARVVVGAVGWHDGAQRAHQRLRRPRQHPRPPGAAAVGAERRQRRLRRPRRSGAPARPGAGGPRPARQPHGPGHGDVLVDGRVDHPAARPADRVPDPARRAHDRRRGRGGGRRHPRPRQPQHAVGGAARDHCLRRDRRRAPAGHPTLAGRARERPLLLPRPGRRRHRAGSGMAGHVVRQRHELPAHGAHRDARAARPLPAVRAPPLPHRQPQRGHRARPGFGRPTQPARLRRLGGMPEPTIEAYYSEDRTFPPSDEFRKQANVSDTSLYDEAGEDWQGFWAKQALALDWFDEWDTIVDWELPFAKWFIGGTLNVSYNCLDRHVAAGKGDKVAYHWEGEPGDTRTITYAQLLDEVQKFANVLKGLGVQRGDRVNIYMPMIPELPVAMLACTRIGAPHSVVFGGFSSDALRDRINDAQARVLITADGGWRRGAPVPLKTNADASVAEAPSIEHVVVVKRTDTSVDMVEGRDHWWHDLMAGAAPECPPEHMDAEDLLYLLYTSGTTAKPKGIMHTTGGYLTQVAFTHKYVFDLHADTDVYWCAADIGWVTGHSYIVYGPLANGATSVMYEGTPDFPDKDRWWAIIERY